MRKFRQQTCELGELLNRIKVREITNAANVGRHFMWKKQQVNELIVTVLNDDYMPCIIFVEKDSQLKLLDGSQRCAALNQFRYGNYKVTPSLSNPFIEYQRKVRDEKGKVQTDGQGAVIWEKAVFDIRNKTYENLPEELKKRFCEYTVDTIIHEHCDDSMISCYFRRYNNHTAMNSNQKSLARIGIFARDVREMAECGFFCNCSSFTEKEKIKGVVERVIVETVMCSYHLDDWKKQMKTMCIYLNHHACKKEFKKLAEELFRLEQVVTNDLRGFFNQADAFLFLTLFHRFTKYGVKDCCFAEFLRAFMGGLRTIKVNGKTFDELDDSKGRKEKEIILFKLNYLEKLMIHFLNGRKISFDHANII